MKKYTLHEIEAARKIASSLYPQENAPDSDDDILNKSYGEDCFLAGINWQKQQTCEHDWVYKIMQDHSAANVCTKCGKIEFQKP